MTNNASTFTPSTQILEAAEQAQALADAGKALKPFLPQETQQAVEGVGKIADALNATGQALKHFGFDEAEPQATSSDESFTLVEPPSLNPIDHFYPTFSQLPPSTFVIAGGQALQENGLTIPGVAVEGAGRIMQSFGYDEAEPDAAELVETRIIDPHWGGWGVPEEVIAEIPMVGSGPVSVIESGNGTSLLPYLEPFITNHGKPLPALDPNLVLA